MERRGSHSRGERKPFGARVRTRAAQAVRAGLAMAEVVTMTPRVAAPATAPEVFAASARPAIVQEAVPPAARAGIDITAPTATIVRPISGAQEASPTTNDNAPVTARLTAETQTTTTDTTPLPTRAQLTAETQATTTRATAQDNGPETSTYTVRSGDSFWKIAAQRIKSFTHKKATTPQINQGMHELIGLYGNKNPNSLKVGQKIKVFSSRVMGGASVIDGIKLPQGSPTQATTLQTELNHANDYKKGTSVNSLQVRKDDKKLADTMQGLIVAAQKKKGAISQLLQQNNISLSTFIPHSADHQPVRTVVTADIHRTSPRVTSGRHSFVDVTSDVATTLTASAHRAALDSLTNSRTSSRDTVYTSRGTHPVASAVSPKPISLAEQVSFAAPDNYQPKKEVHSLLPTVIDSNARLGNYSSIWGKLAAQEIAGRKLTPAELNFVSQLTRAMNAYGKDRTLSSDTLYNGFTDQATLFLAAFSHLSSKELAAIGQNIPLSVADALTPLRQLTEVNERSASLSDYQAWELNSRAMTAAVNLLTQLGPALGDKEVVILSQIMKTPASAAKEFTTLLNNPKIINALNGKATTPRVLATTI